MTDKELIKYLVDNNDYKYNLLKTAEELNELSTILLQYVNKENKVDKQKIIEEIGDSIIRIEVLKKLFNEKKIKLRINFKLKKFKTYIKNKKYIGKI
jgi:hypothetical protein